MAVAVRKVGLEADGAGNRWWQGSQRGPSRLAPKLLCGMARSQAAISAVKTAGKTGKARTANLARVVELVVERRRRLRDAGAVFFFFFLYHYSHAALWAMASAGAVKLAWVKAHVGIEGNEMPDGRTKEGARCMRYDGQATEVERVHALEDPGSHIGELNLPAVTMRGSRAIYVVEQRDFE
ncbi:hypothetical protein BDZ91DRAFT_793106 [Kalaharituber pfeilii]|nr:hypothetical protein BDZ91DRAFT_793106 [Kalaharituber pfeilii]